MKKHFLSIVFISFLFTQLFAQQLKHVQGELIVQLAPNSEVSHLLREMTRLNQEPTDIQIKKELSPPLRIWLFEFDFVNVDENMMLKKVRSLRYVENAQFNHIGEYRQTVPDDPAFFQQWMWQNTGQTGGLANADIDVDLAWDLTTGGLTADGHEIVVCVVEGTNRNHPDLVDNLWYNEAEIEGDGIDNDNNGYVDDYNGWNINQDNDNINAEGHGTFVSGIIGAVGNNNMFVSGVNWNIKIMNVDFQGVNEANSIEAYTYPLVMRRRYNETGGAEGAFVVATNSSWGIDGGDPEESPIWCAMYDSLGLAGILSCGATTNSNVNIDDIGDLPTACSSEYLISVTATDHNDVRTFSGFGIEHVDVGAPGEDAISLNLNGGPSSSSGTSYASPTVAGIIGLLYASPCSTLGSQALGAPAETAALVRDAIYAGVDTIPNLVGEIKYGGRVNAFNAMQLVLANCGPCPTPFGIQAEGITDTSATLSWYSTDSTLSTNMIFRVADSLQWDTFYNVTSPYFFTELDACTEYEIQLEDYCSEDSSGFSVPVTFLTDGCCLPPSGLTVEDFTATTAIVTWDSLLAANSYQLQLTSPTDTVLFTDIVDSEFILDDLDSCTVYQLQVQTVCDTGITAFSVPVEFKTLGCGSCTDLNYCPSVSDDSSEEWIANVSIGTLNNTSESNDGYGNFTNLSTDLITYQTYEISLAPGYPGFGFNEWFKAYIDFNQDGDFNDENEEIFDAGGASNDPVQGNVFIPGDAIPGSTRMRVVMKFNNEPSACESSINFGEVEDYCVNIIEGEPIICETPSLLITDSIDLFQADFSWQGHPEALSYEVQLKQTAGNDWQVIAAQDTFFTATNLDSCVSYECQVRAVCSGAKSDWSLSTYFMTDCASGTNELPSDIEEWAIAPNPVNHQPRAIFRLNKPGKVTFELVEMTGRTIVKQEGHFRVGESTVQLFDQHLSALPAGIYFVKIKTSTGFGIKKIVKN